jgi:hypothetical protein
MVLIFGSKAMCGVCGKNISKKASPENSKSHNDAKLFQESVLHARRSNGLVCSFIWGEFAGERHMAERASPHYHYYFNNTTRRDHLKLQPNNIHTHTQVVSSHTLILEAAKSEQNS